MRQLSVYLIAALFLVAGIMHFLKTDAFVTIYPDYLPAPKEMVYLSGIFEIAGAIGFTIKGTRIVAAFGLILLLVAVFPANVNMAVNADRFGFPAWVLWARLPLQLLLIAWVLWASGTDRPS